MVLHRGRAHAGRDDVLAADLADGREGDQARERTSDRAEAEDEADHRP
jgi:hypothetical protein